MRTSADWRESEKKPDLWYAPYSDMIMFVYKRYGEPSQLAELLGIVPFLGWSFSLKQKDDAKNGKRYWSPNLYDTLGEAQEAAEAFVVEKYPCRHGLCTKCGSDSGWPEVLSIINVKIKSAAGVWELHKGPFCKLCYNEMQNGREAEQLFLQNFPALVEMRRKQNQ